MPRIVIDGQPVEYQPGDSVAVAALRAGQHPAHGGTLCLAGDCPNCTCIVDGTAWVRTCQTPARPGLVVQRHPAVGAPTPLTEPSAKLIGIDRAEVDVVVIGRGESGRAAADEARAAGHEVLIAGDGMEVVAVYPGPTVVARLQADWGVVLHLHAHEVVIATGAAELHPTCPGNRLRGLVTAKAAQALTAAGVPLGRAVAVGEVPGGVECTPVDGDLVRFEGEDTVSAVVVRTADGTEVRHEADTVILGLGRSPRDLLSRMAKGTPGVRVVGPAAEAFPLPPPPVAGTVCPCSRVEVEDLEGVWARGFNDLELVKRASLCGTGTCQGAVCGPHLRAFVAARQGETPPMFTARPNSRQLTIAEAGAGLYVDAWKRTALHHEHVRMGARMDRFGGWWRPWNYGDAVAEYWAVREAVSLGDVSTLGKLVVSGPDVLDLLERLYPTTIADIKPGRSRYVLLLNERGHVIDDGMVCRETDDRFVLTFTSGGVANAEMWIRDWIETWGLDVRVLDRTMALGAINVTGPLAPELLRRCGVETVPTFLQHRHLDVAGIACHVMRLSFTGETSFELHHDVTQSVELWRRLFGEGIGLGIKPHGLQALFGLRLEKGHVIVGQDTELDTTPRRIGMDWAVKMSKPDFVGRPALERTSRLVDHRRLVGLTVDGPAPVEGSPVWLDGQVVGHVTSSWASPILGRSVMLGWVKRGWSEDVTAVEVDGRTATVTEPPFYDKEGARARL